MLPRTLAVALACVAMLTPASASSPATPAAPPATASATDEVPEALVDTFAWPVPRARVLRAFAAPSSPWGAGHRGIDVAAAPGETVVAATAGTVTFAGTVVDRPVVTIRMDGLPWEVLETVEPVDPLVSVGDVVEREQPIGTLVGGHRPCGACVHLGVRVDDEYVNPMTLLGAERAVLLPMQDAAGSSSRGRRRSRAATRAGAPSGTRP